MLGLFIKDLKLLKAQKKLFMLVGIVTAVVLFNIQDGTEMIGFMAGYMVFVVTMAATSTIGCDEADHGTVFLFTLPVSRKEYVLEKYGLAVAGSAAAVCVVTVLVYLVSVVRGSQLMAEQLFIILIMMPLALILFSLMVPFQLRFGAEKGRMMLLGAYGAVFGGLYIVKNLTEKWNVDLSWIGQKIERYSQGTWTILAAVAALAVMLVSYFASVRILNIKEID